MNNFFQQLECSSCAETFPHTIPQNLCHSCGKPLFARYALDQLTDTWKPKQLQSRPNSLWRYRELLPIIDDKNIVSLGETMTPLIHAKRLGLQFDLKQLWLKDESRLPTGVLRRAV